MLAVFHHVQDGAVISTCPTHPNWCHFDPGGKINRAEVEQSLRDFIARTTTYSHYKVPPENIDLRKAA